jgi:Cu+-exporting ATPase|tara:strand:- start:14 stop:376 length:363 start_codon:yes stop_codon:yes gene_type:complete
MRTLKYTFLLLSLTLFFACQEKITKNEKTETVTENIQNIEVNIEGMTCEIGCAKLIESKVHKLEGVTYSNVNFEHKIGHFSFDSNKISKEELAKNLNGIAGGELYKATQITLVNDFKTVQ